MIATLRSMERLTGTKIVCEFEQGFTDDWDIHLQADELEELEAINVGHDDVTDHQFELVHVLPLPEHVQRRLRVRHRCHCTRHKSCKKNKKQKVARKFHLASTSISITMESRGKFTGAAKKARTLTVVVTMLQLFL